MPFKEYYSAQEIADAATRLKLKVVPGTKRGVQDFINRQGWAGSPLCRRRAGAQRGGNEYHFTLLPVFLQTALQSEYLRCCRAVALTEETNRDVVLQERLETGALTARQRAVMEARAGVVNEVLRRCNATGCSQRAAILSFLEDMNAGALPPALASLALRANDKKRRGGQDARQGNGINGRGGQDARQGNGINGRGGQDARQGNGINGRGGQDARQGNGINGRGLSRGTIARWLAARESGGLSALAPHKTREKAAPPAWMKGFLKYYRTPQKLSVAHAWNAWRRDSPSAQLPALHQVRHALAKLPEIDRQRGRMGNRELKSLRAYTSRDVADLMPASVYQADGKTFVSEVAHPLHGQPFRPELTTMIDVKTRKVVGWSASLDENALGVVDALRMAVCENAIPAILYTDNGPGYRNGMMEHPLTGFLARLGITPSHARAWNSQAKGIVERFNRHWTNLSRELPTYIGRDMDRQARMLAHRTTRRQLKTAGVSKLLPSWPQFLDACRLMVDDYNNSPHRGLDKTVDPQTGKRRHMTPNEAWARGIEAGFAPLTVAEDEAVELFRPWVVRKVSRCLVSWQDNRYFAEALEPYHGRDVIVGYDIHDAGNVTVRAINLVDGERQPGRLIAVARFEGNRSRFVPLSFEQAAMEKRHKARKARVMKKAGVIDAELRRMTIETCSRAEPARPLPAAETPAPRGAGTEKFHVAGRRPNFRTDGEYAVWLLANPEKITPQDQANIRDDLLATRTLTDLLQRQGIDLAALAALAHSNAA